MTELRTDKRIALISTGGTIEKTYDELAQVLSNNVSNLDIMLGTLELGDLAIVRVPLMNKDSLEMTDADHTLIAQTTGSMAQSHDGVVIVHGTDRLAQTGDRLVELLGTPRVPVVLTGAMRPYQLRTTDAIQNMTESLLAVQLLESGVYVCMHNKVLQFPGVRKDAGKGTFVKDLPVHS
jgi:L-asparaginase